MGALSGVHWLIIAIVAAFLFFGWKQLPDMARSFGRSLRVFKTEIKGMTDDDSAREKAKDGAAEQGAPKQLAPRPVPNAAPVVQRDTPRAEVVRNEVPSADVASARVAPGEAAPQAAARATRPRPAPGRNA